MARKRRQNARIICRMLFLVLLERLSPTERAVFILREAFEYDYEAIAGMVGKSGSNCRQIFSRAKRILQTEPASRLPSLRYGAVTENLLVRFTAAFTSYDVGGMLELLGEHPVLVADGGGPRGAYDSPADDRPPGSYCTADLEAGYALFAGVEAFLRAAER
ncbi:sigma factor-like helix-turn-helix DNA-binding protein [Paenibacillus rhizoplanae]